VLRIILSIGLEIKSFPQPAGHIPPLFFFRSQSSLHFLQIRFEHVLHWVGDCTTQEQSLQTRSSFTGRGSITSSVSSWMVTLKEGSGTSFNLSATVCLANYWSAINLISTFFSSIYFCALITSSYFLARSAKVCSKDI
jgi:hypothetical protein